MRDEVDTYLQPTDRMQYCTQWGVSKSRPALLALTHCTCSRKTAAKRRGGKSRYPFNSHSYPHLVLVTMV